MKQESNLLKIYSSFLVFIFTIFIHPPIAEADTANPPKIESMKMLNTEKIYKVGDVVTFSIKFSGGSPGLKRVDLWAYSYNQGKYSHSDCLVGESWYSLWGDKPSNYGLPIGPISSTEILMYKYVSANCIKGVNEVRLAARIADLTDLETNQVTGGDSFKFSVLDGLWVPPGELLGNTIDTTFNLNFLPSEVVLEQGKSLEIKIPTRTSEGVPIAYQPWPGDVCVISQEPAFPRYQPIENWFTIIEFKKSGTCSLTSHNATLTRSIFKEFVFRKEIKVITQLEFATAKAAAEKAAAELKAKQEADAKAAAEANRREQIISSTPFWTGSVPFSSAGLQTKVGSNSNLPVFAYNSTDNVCVYENGVIRTKTSGRCVIAFSQEGNSEFKPAKNLVLDFTIVEATKKTTTITCVKGKLTKKVTAVNPKCPAGYKKK